MRLPLNVNPARLGWPLLLGLGALALFWAGRCAAPGPATPSQDSTALRHYADALDSVAKVSAKRDSLRNATVDSLVGAVADARRKARTALQHRSKPVQPVSTAPDSIRWLTARVDTLEAENDSLRAGWARTLVTDSVAVDSLGELYRGQLAETAGLRDLLAGAADSLEKAAVRIGRLEAKVRTAGCVKLLGVPMPSLGVGVAGIVGVDGRPGYGPAVTLSYRLGCLVR